MMPHPKRAAEVVIKRTDTSVTIRYPGDFYDDDNVKKNYKSSLNSGAEGCSPKKVHQTCHEEKRKEKGKLSAVKPESVQVDNREEKEFFVDAPERTQYYEDGSYDTVD